MTIFGEVNHHAVFARTNAQSNFSIGSKVSTPNALDGMPIGEAPDQIALTTTTFLDLSRWNRRFAGLKPK